MTPGQLHQTDSYPPLLMEQGRIAARNGIPRCANYPQRIRKGLDQRIYFRTNANPPKAMVINMAELPASGTGGGRGAPAIDVPTTITPAKIKRPSDIFDFCIFIYVRFLCVYEVKPL